MSVGRSVVWWGIRIVLWRPVLHRYVGASVTVRSHRNLNMSPQLLDTELWSKVAAWRPAGVRYGDTWVGCHVALVMYGLGVMWHCGDTWVGCHVALVMYGLGVVALW